MITKPENLLCDEEAQVSASLGSRGLGVLGLLCIVAVKSASFVAQKWMFICSFHCVVSLTYLGEEDIN